MKHSQISYIELSKIKLPKHNHKINTYEIRQDTSFKKKFTWRNILYHFVLLCKIFIHLNIKILSVDIYKIDRQPLDVEATPAFYIFPVTKDCRTFEVLAHAMLTKLNVAQFKITLKQTDTLLCSKHQMLSFKHITNFRFEVSTFYF